MTRRRHESGPHAARRAATRIGGLLLTEACTDTPDTINPMHRHVPNRRPATMMGRCQW